MQVAVSCPFAAEAEVFENLLSRPTFVFDGWAAAHLPAFRDQQTMLS